MERKGGGLYGKTLELRFEWDCELIGGLEGENSKAINSSCLRNMETRGGKWKVKRARSSNKTVVASPKRRLSGGKKQGRIVLGTEIRRKSEISWAKSNKGKRERKREVSNRSKGLWEMK